MDDDVMKLGLLMESVQSLQALADRALKDLALRTGEIDAIVRTETRRAVSEELQAFSLETRGAIAGLRQVKRAVAVRVGFWSLVSAVVSALLALGTQWVLLPSPGELARLRTAHADLIATVARLEKAGGKVDLRRCGQPERLCVRVDKRAPVYGEAADYFVAKGY